MKPFHLSTVSRRDVVIWTKTSRFLEESRAWGAQSAEPEYEKKGEIITIDDLDMYVVGDGPNGNVPCFTSGILEYSV